MDRDGIINESYVEEGKPKAPLKFKDFILTKDLKINLEKIYNLNYKIFVITNQPEISKGNLDINELMKMHNFLKKNFPIDHIDFCPHQDIDNCICRKPKIGMIETINKKYNKGINFKKSFLIGDRKSDMDLGSKIGCKTIFVDYNYNEAKPKFNDFRCKSLSEAINIISNFEMKK